MRTANRSANSKRFYSAAKILKYKTVNSPDVKILAAEKEKQIHTWEQAAKSNEPAPA